ncbi:MAG: hypothetical protein U0V02_04230 [Anaerolineales bacterium]
MNWKKKISFLSMLLIFALSACNLQLVESPQGGEDISLLQTITAQALILEQAGQTATPTVAQNQAIVYITATADGAASVTPEAVIPAAVLPPATGPVTVTVSVATNCRSGPGQSFASLYGMPVGQVAKVVAKNSYTGYWIIEIPGQNGKSCWLWGQYATVTGDTSSLNDVVTPTSAATLKPTTTITPTITATVTSSGSLAVAGCTDPVASNYNSAATVDDGSCIYTAQATILGCTDPVATNYNSKANQDDGSCTYPPPPASAPVFVNSSVVCNDQLDGNYEFIMTINWVPGNSDPNVRYRRSFQWTLNGAIISGGGGSSAQQNNTITTIRPAGAVYTYTVSATNSAGATSQNSVSLTCP